MKHLKRFDESSGFQMYRQLTGQEAQEIIDRQIDMSGEGKGLSEANQKRLKREGVFLHPSKMRGWESTEIMNVDVPYYILDEGGFPISAKYPNQNRIQASELEDGWIFVLISGGIAYGYYLCDTIDGLIELIRYFKKND